MKTWDSSLNTSVEGKVFDKFKKVVKDVLGPNQKEKVTRMETNLKQTFSVESVKKLSNDRLNHLCKHCDDNNKTTVSMADIATAYLVAEAFGKPMLFLSSVLCGDKYPEITSKSKNYLTAVHRVSDVGELTTRSDMVTQLNNIEKSINLGNTANRYIAELYNRTKQRQRPQHGSTVTYITAISVIENLMIGGGTITQQSTNEYPGIMLKEIIENDTVVEDSELSSRAKTLLVEFNKMYTYSRSVDKTSDKVWDEWQLTGKMRVSIADIYYKLSNTKYKPTNERRDYMNDWTNSLQASTEAGGFANIKNKVAKFFGVGDRERVEQFRKARNVKIQTSTLTTLKEPVLARSFHDYLQQQKKTTTTVGELESFYLSSLVVQSNLQGAFSVLTGKGYLPAFNNLHDLMDSINQYTQNPEKGNFETTVKELDKLLSRIEKTYSVINLAFSNTKEVKANSLKNGSSFRDVLEHHQKILQIYWETNPDTPFALRKTIATLLENTGTASSYNGQLKGLSVRLEEVLKEMKTTAGHVGAIASEWELLNKHEIKIANIYDGIKDTSITGGVESNSWALAIACESNDGEEDKDMGEVSDGSHTFNELYHVRTILFAVICNQNKETAWKSKLHSDGTMFNDYFIAGATTPDGDFTFHQHLDYWDKFDVEEMERGKEWDGHKTSDVVRLLSL